MKTYIMISGSLSKEFFIEFVKIINKLNQFHQLLFLQVKKNLD